MADPYLILATKEAINKAHETAADWLENKSGADGDLNGADELTRQLVVMEFLLNQNGQTMITAKQGYQYQTL